jgi:hypothetical protein
MIKNQEIANQIIETLEKVAKLPKTRETSLVFTKLEEALMWLMKADTVAGLNMPFMNGPK